MCCRAPRASAARPNFLQNQPAGAKPGARGQTVIHRKRPQRHQGVLLQESAPARRIYGKAWTSTFMEDRGERGVGQGHSSLNGASGPMSRRRMLSQEVSHSQHRGMTFKGFLPRRPPASLFPFHELRESVLVTWEIPEKMKFLLCIL